jgi:hypothetical protein
LVKESNENKKNESFRLLYTEEKLESLRKSSLNYVDVNLKEEWSKYFEMNKGNEYSLKILIYTIDVMEFLHLKGYVFLKEIKCHIPEYFEFTNIIKWSINANIKKYYKKS